MNTALYSSCYITLSEWWNWHTEVMSVIYLDATPWQVISSEIDVTGCSSTSLSAHLGYISEHSCYKLQITLHSFSIATVKHIQCVKNNTHALVRQSDGDGSVANSNLLDGSREMKTGKGNWWIEVMVWHEGGWYGWFNLFSSLNLFKGRAKCRGIQEWMRLEVFMLQ